MANSTEENLDSILDTILISRPNGSDNLEAVGSYLQQFLADTGADVTTHVFSATPHGFQLVWSAVLLLMITYVFAISRKAYGWALLMCLITPVLLLAEFEFMLSPISGLLPNEQENIIGTYVGANANSADARTLIFSAHYDTTTHFGDHFSWGFWGSMQGPAQGLAFALIAVGFWRKRNNKPFTNKLAVPVALLAILPFAAMFWFQSIGPLVRTPSIGAVDNGGSMAALLLFAEKMQARPSSAPTTVKIVFLSAEEERGLGSWAYARYLLEQRKKGGKIRQRTQVINLESIGISSTIAYIPEDGFALTRYRSSPEMVSLVNTVAQHQFGHKLEARELPFGVLTDGRSFLAHDTEAITLRAFTDGEFPRQLHSRHDSRERLSNKGIEKGAEILWALVASADR